MEKEFHRLQFLVDTGSEHIKKEMEISLQAGELVGVLYDALLKQYKDPPVPSVRSGHGWIQYSHQWNWYGPALPGLQKKWRWNHQRQKPSSAAQSKTAVFPVLPKAMVEQQLPDEIVYKFNKMVRQFMKDNGLW